MKLDPSIPLWIVQVSRVSQNAYTIIQVFVSFKIFRYILRKKIYICLLSLYIYIYVYISVYIKCVFANFILQFLWGRNLEAACLGDLGLQSCFELLQTEPKALHIQRNALPLIYNHIITLISLKNCSRLDDTESRTFLPKSPSICFVPSYKGIQMGWS